MNVSKTKVMVIETDESVTECVVRIGSERLKHERICESG